MNETTLKEYCERFQTAFSQPWTEERLDAIAKIERVVRDGGFEKIELPRGAGTSTIFLYASNWGAGLGYDCWINSVKTTTESPSVEHNKDSQTVVFFDVLR